MDFFTALRVSGSGLSAERTRVNLASSNLANAETTRGPDGQPYKRLDPVFQAVAMEGANATPGAPGEKPMGVEVSQVVADQTPGKRVYSPGHPDADADGYVALPNVNVVTEMVDMMAATRAYEANIAALNATKRVLEAALEIGRG